MFALYNFPLTCLNQVVGFLVERHWFHIGIVLRLTNILFLWLISCSGSNVSFIFYYLLIFFCLNILQLNLYVLSLRSNRYSVFKL